MTRLLLLTTVFFSSCVTTSYARRCPYVYEHSCDLWYQAEVQSECRRDVDSQTCKDYRRVIKARKKADAEKRCYADEVCIK